MAENSNASSFNPIDTSTQKSSGKPKSIFWYKGSPASLEAHLGNSYNKAPPDSQLSDFVESTKLTPDRIKDIIRALVKAFIVCELLKTLCPAYEPPSKDILSGRYLAQETAFVNQAMIKQLNSSKNMTL
ncbi:24153_t:CDS:2, partial [Dentiscutata erythropus]